MLFSKQSEIAIKNSVIWSKWKADNDRREEAQNKLDLYMDDYEEIIRKKISELFCKENYDRLYYHVNQTQNILKRVIKEISMVYKAPVKRTLSSEDKRYKEIKTYLNLDAKLKKVNKYTNLFNECLIKIGVRDEKIVYDIITPNICLVIQNEDDPTKPDAIMYQTTRVNTLGSSEIKYYYWDVMGNHRLLDEMFRIKAEYYDWDSYPYREKDGLPFLPFVIFHRQEPDGDFWDQDTGRDLYNAALMTGIKMTLFDYYFKVASFKQPYIIGDEVKIPAKQIADPLTVFQATGENAQIGLLDMQINLDQLKNALVFQINTIINNYGISSDAWSLSVNEMSGRALKIRNRALLESREDQLSTYRDGEQELFEKTRIINNVHFPNAKISDAAELNIDFGEIEFPEDPKDELAFEKERLKSGIISLGQFYQHFNPDIEDEIEAEKKIIENLNKLKAARDENSALDEMINEVMAKTQTKTGIGGAQ